MVENIFLSALLCRSLLGSLLRSSLGILLRLLGYLGSPYAHVRDRYRAATSRCTEVEQQVAGIDCRYGEHPHAVARTLEVECAEVGEIRVLDVLPVAVVERLGCVALYVGEVGP